MVTLLKSSTFSVGPNPDVDSGSVFHFAHHCGVADFRRFLTAFLAPSLADVYGTWRI